LRNICHCTSLPQRAFHPTDHVQEDIHPTDNIHPQPLTQKSGAGKARRRADDDGGCSERRSVRQSLRALVMQSSAPAPGTPSPWDSAMGDIEDSISQCTLLQMTYTAENPPADGIATPGVRPRFRPPRRRDPHATSPAPTTTGCQEDKCPVVSKRPLHSRAELQQTMSPHIRIGPEPVLTAHVPSPPAANSAGIHCPAREDSAPHCGTEFRFGSSSHVQQNGLLSQLRTSMRLCVLLRSAKSTTMGKNALTIRTFLFSPPLSAQAHACTVSVFFFYRPTGRPRRTSLPLECHRNTTC
jgi:hypothetical protein